MRGEIQKYVHDLQHAVTVAGLNYEIWWTYKEKESRKKYFDAMNEYTIFFQTSIHAHFVALLIALYRLYESRTDTVNIPGLIKLLHKYADIPKTTLEYTDKLYKEAHPLWVKVSVLRNEAFGHRSNKFSVSEVFDKAKVTPDKLRELIEKTKELLNEITHEWDKSIHAFNYGATEDTVRLLEDLGELREIRANKRFEPTP